MTITNSKTFLLAAVLAVAATAAPAATLGDRLASGQMSRGAFVQLIAGSGLTEAEAVRMTLDEVAAIKWTDD